MGEFSISHVLILTLILLVFFGPSRLPALGQSLGKAIRGFKDAMNDAEKGFHSPPPSASNPTQASQTESLKTTDESVILTDKDKQHQNNS